MLIALVAAATLASAPDAGARPPSHAWLASGGLSAIVGSWWPSSAGIERSYAVRGRARRGLLADAVTPAIEGAAGEISGAVTSAESKAPIEGVEVCAYSGTAPGESCAITGAGGDYLLAALAPGEYTVEFYVPLRSQLDYVTQYYDAKSTEAEAQAVIVTGERNTSGIDAALQSGGTFAGSVTDTTNSPINGIEVCALERGSKFIDRCATTNSAGEYAIVGLAAGEYDVEFSAPSASGLNYVTQYYNAKAALAEAQPVTAVSAVTVPAIDAKLTAGAKITGTVTSAATKSAVGDVQVCAYQAALEAERCAVTSAAGEYTILGLAAGGYEVQFAEPPEGTRNYATQYYNAKAEASEAQTVSLGAQATKAAIDAELTAGGRVEGTVSNLAEHLALSGVEVCAIRISPLAVRCTTTNALGGYDVTSMSTGSYFVGFHSPTGEYATQFYFEAASLGAAVPVSVNAGVLSAPIDAALKQRIPPKVLTPPRISGGALEGQTLSAQHGSWTNAPTGYRDEWGRCNGAGELSSCATVAVGETYTLSASDLGHAIRLRESASNEAGTGALAYSTATASVGPAPQSTVPPGPPTPPVSYSAPAISAPTVVAPSNSGVLGATSSAASAAEVKALLISILTPMGKGAKLRALLAHGGYSTSLNAPLTGHLSISWYLPAVHAHRATLIARGSVSFAEGTAPKFTIKLTATARNLLRHVRKAKLTAQGTLTPNNQAPITATRSFSLSG